MIIFMLSVRVRGLKNPVVPAEALFSLKVLGFDHSIGIDLVDSMKPQHSRIQILLKVKDAAKQSKLELINLLSEQEY